MYLIRGRSKWKIIKILVFTGYLVLMIYFATSIFNSKDSPEHHHNNSVVLRAENDLNIPQLVLEFENKVIDGAGANGQGHHIRSQTQQEKDVIIKKHAFNKPVSDQISLKRNIPDVRHESCKHIVYDKDLPKASVILIFNNEALSALLRTVWSVLRNTPMHLLHEIVLVDDGSNSTEITEVLPLYVKHRLPSKVLLTKLPTQTGLIYARTAGADTATGEVIIFLDSHCEATVGWAEPLLQRIKDNPSTVVIPNIDSISDDSLAFSGSPGGIGISVGGFTWSGHFSWESYRDPTGNRKASDPAPTPTMAGGLFAADRKFFWDVGGYDKGMIGWGGENLELSFRVWRCHGRMENIPCSHVGHIFRAFHPYFIPDDSHGKNTMRMAEVWMDDYKRFFYLYRTDLKAKVSEMGDLSDRHAIKDKLKCKSFRWFLDNVIPHKFRMDEEGVGWGRVRNAQWNICFDHLQKDMGHKLSPYSLGQYPCHEFMGASQYYVITEKGQLRNEYMCAEPFKDYKSGNTLVKMYACSRGNKGQEWEYTDKQQLKHVASQKCLTAKTPDASELLTIVDCDDSSKEQIWKFEFTKEP